MLRVLCSDKSVVEVPESVVLQSSVLNGCNEDLDAAIHTPLYNVDGVTMHRIVRFYKGNDDFLCQCERAYAIVQLVLASDYLDLKELRLAASRELERRMARNEDLNI